MLQQHLKQFAKHKKPRGTTCLAIEKLAICSCSSALSSFMIYLRPGPCGLGRWGWGGGLGRWGWGGLGRWGWGGLGRWGWGVGGAREMGVGGTREMGVGGLGRWGWGVGRWGWGGGGCTLYSVYYQYSFILILTRNNFLLKKISPS